eukprot:m.75389 g.75389  ORF g.75389 m.75389 type:complete len:363 (-) comp17162_c0_seq3:93-1181(-)
MRGRRPAADHWYLDLVLLPPPQQEQAQDLQLQGVQEGGGAAQKARREAVVAAGRAQHQNRRDPPQIRASAGERIRRRTAVGRIGRSAFFFSCHLMCVCFFFLPVPFFLCRAIKKNPCATEGHMLSRVVLPGDAVSTEPDQSATEAPEKSKRLRLGPGLASGESEGKLVVTATKCGVLREIKSSNSYWVENSQKRYVAVPNENVIGIVTAAKGENYAVDIGTSQTATLGGLAFEGATKRSRPKLQVGALVYARLSLADRDMEPELQCVDASGRSAGLGLLEGGHMFTVPLSLSRMLLRADCRVLARLGEHVRFEVAVGLNGRVWVKGETVQQTILVAAALQSAEGLSSKQTDQLVKSLLRKLS